jgi:hypothetical protein
MMRQPDAGRSILERKKGKQVSSSTRGTTRSV